MSPVQLAVQCGECERTLRLLEAADTPERLHLELRDVVTHDKSLPLLFDRQRAQPDIPADAALACHEALKFPMRFLGAAQISCIKTSLQEGVLKDKLSQKMGAAGRHAYLRIGVGLRSLGPTTAVLELWPAGHTSPKHQHGGCAGSIRLLHGMLEMVLYRSLTEDEPIRWKDGEAGLVLPALGPRDTVPLLAGQTTWLNRANWFVHEVSCPRDRPENAEGFALSLHVYKSCLDEFEFLQDGSVQKRNPTNDFFWNLDLPADDPRVDEADAFATEVLGAPRAQKRKRDGEP